MFNFFIANFFFVDIKSFSEAIIIWKKVEFFFLTYPTCLFFLLLFSINARNFFVLFYFPQTLFHRFSPPPFLVVLDFFPPFFSHIYMYVCHVIFYISSLSPLCHFYSLLFFFIILLLHCVYHFSFYSPRDLGTLIMSYYILDWKCSFICCFSLNLLLCRVI